MARRSTRLSNRNAATPQRTALQEDTIMTAPHTVPAKLSAVTETDEMPGAFPHASSPLVTTKEAGALPAGTPSKTTPIMPSAQVMHPQHHQQSTARPLDEARYLGFSNMGAHTAPPRQFSQPAMLQSTPTKSNGLANENGSPSFQFTFRRERSLELSPEAKKLMMEKREEVAKIRQQMIADGHEMETAESILERKIAVPKGRFGRAHQTQFDKMDSIAGHPSAFRADPHRLAPRTPASEAKFRTSQAASTPKSLKRSPSKAGLDDAEIPSKPTPSFAVKTFASASGSKRVESPQRGRQSADAPSQLSPSKRVRIAENSDVSATKPKSKVPTSEPVVTPRSVRSVKAPVQSHRKFGLATPTQASLARTSGTASNQACKIPGPPSTVVKSADRTNQRDQTNHVDPQSPLLLRSTKKAPLFSSSGGDRAPLARDASPLLARTPFKSSVLRKSETSQQQDSQQKPGSTPLLSQSPTKSVSPKKFTHTSDGARKEIAPVVPLLAQSPVKVSTGKADEDTKTQPRTDTVPYLARSPAKFQMHDMNSLTAPTSGSAGGNATPGRLKLLQVSPMKSILRTPQRLYSNDPARVAAGTHFATPPMQRSTLEPSGPPPPSTATRKRVDFTSSTKAGAEPSARGSSSTTPKESPSSSKSRPGSTQAQSSSIVDYPSLPTDLMPPSPSPQKRRMTGGPRDFTFRAGDHDIIFGPSPNARKSLDQTARVSTIRHVSSDVITAATSVTGSKKRKFDFENAAAASEELGGGSGDNSDKENAPAPAVEESETRPVKRSKLSSPAVKPNAPASAKKPATKLPTLGVKPKKDSKPVTKRANTISQSRLNSLAQPKRRA